MAEAISFTIEGQQEVVESLKNIAKGIESSLALNKELSSSLSQKASAMAPRLTGALASSVKGNPTAEKAQILAGGQGVPYAGVIEYGWPLKNIQAQPYLRAAVNNNMDYIVTKYSNYIDSIIKKYNLD